MSGILGKFTNGHVVLAESVDWPDGTEVRVEPTANGNEIARDDRLLGDDPASIARWLAWYDSLQPLTLTPEEEGALRLAQKQQAEFEMTTFDERAEELRRLFE